MKIGIIKKVREPSIREIQKPISTLPISVGNKVKSWVLLSDCNFLEL